MGHKLFSYFTLPFLVYLYLFPFVCPYHSANSQLDYRFYDRSCPRLSSMVKYGVWAAYKNDIRIAASLLRLHFHDCFVNVTTYESVTSCLSMSLTFIIQSLIRTILKPKIKRCHVIGRKRKLKLLSFTYCMFHYQENEKALQ